MTSSTDRAEAHEALELMIEDLAALCRLHARREAAPKTSNDESAMPGDERMLDRLFLTSAILLLSKLLEFLDRYRALIPPEFDAEIDALRNDLRIRGIRSIRKLFVGRLYDEDLMRSLNRKEIDTAFTRVAAGSMRDFFRWLSGGESTGQTGVGVFLRRLDRGID